MPFSISRSVRVSTELVASSSTQNRRFAERGARDIQKLALSLRKIRAVAFDYGIVTV